MADNKNEIGYTGLVEYSGQIRDDFLKEFHGKEAYKRFNEMRLNNATIGAGLLAIEYIIRSMSWEFTSDEDEDPWQEFVEESRKGMSQSWNDLVSEAISFVWAGFSIFEIIYKRDEAGRLTWRKFAPRGQDTVYQWLFDDTGGLAGFRQLAAPKYQAVDIPMEKSILFRTRLEKNNPEGRSLLRIAWVSYYYLKNLQQIEAIGFERDVNGLPVIKLPEGADTNESSTTSDASKAAKIVRNMRVDEQAGLVLPFGWDALLLSGNGKSFDSLSNAIERYEKRIATAFFSQFLMLGQDGVGSMALSESSTDFFMSAVNAIADIFSETFTKYAVYRLLKLNGATDEEARRVKLTHTPASSVNIEKIGAFIGSIKDLMTWDENDELWLRQLAGAPERDPEQLKADRDNLMREKAEAAKAFAERVTKQPEREDNEAEHFEAGAPDDKRRTKYEKAYEKEIASFLEKQQRRILKAARAMKNA
jgi:hypothetical protein